MPPAVNPAYNVTYVTGNTPATQRASLDASPGGPLATAPHHWVTKALPKIFHAPRADNTYHKIWAEEPPEVVGYMPTSLQTSWRRRSYA
jgi:hypothetical protein